MADSHKSIRCAQIVDAIPWQAYRIPSDGRKARSRCLQRRTLLVKLSKAANPDGTGITVSVSTLATAIGDSVRTITYLLDELTTDLKFLRAEGLTKFNGTMRRSIDLEILQSTWKAIQGRDSTAPLEDAEAHLSDDQKRTLDNPEAHLAPACTAPSAFETPQRCALPKSLTVNQPPLTEAGWLGFVESLPAMMRKEIPLLGRADVDKFKEILAAHGAKQTHATIANWIDTRPMPVEGLRQLKCRAFLNEFEAYLPVDRDAAEREAQKKVDEAEAFGRQIAADNLRHAELVEEYTPEELEQIWKQVK